MHTWEHIRTPAGDRLRSSLDSQEINLLQNLAYSLLDLLTQRQESAPADELQEITGIQSGHSSPPDDPVLRRLLPDFYSSDSEDDLTVDVDILNAGLRSLYEPDIIAAKQASLKELLGSLPHRPGRFELSLPQAHCWTEAINDMRLTMGTVLGIGSPDPDVNTDTTWYRHYTSMYQWLTVFQEYLVSALVDLCDQP